MKSPARTENAGPFEGQRQKAERQPQVIGHAGVLGENEANRWLVSSSIGSTALLDDGGAERGDGCLEVPPHA
jgi:hypothetical protein